MKKVTFRVPKDRADKVAGLLILMGDRLARSADQRLEQWNIGESDYNVLRILNGALKPLTQVEIGRRLLCSRANVTKIVDRLQQKKMVSRRPAADRRENLVGITSRGVKFLRDTILEMLSLSDESMAPLSRQELIGLERLLHKLAGNSPAVKAPEYRDREKK